MCSAYHVQKSAGTSKRHGSLPPHQAAQAAPSPASVYGSRARLSKSVGDRRATAPEGKALHAERQRQRVLMEYFRQKVQATGEAKQTDAHLANLSAPPINDGC